ncbi:hypothetical protein DL98DRAFT_655779 [Cadophora sp. DSE1049]|nr:hypothetical protein DL98DRAFT_655779 [Cadophora sp. DSE1049]
MVDAGLQTQGLYTCNSCILPIPPHLARVTCHSCPNHHLCANCHAIKSSIRPHTDSHSTMVFKQSGVVVPLPPGFAPRPPPALPPRPKSTVNDVAAQDANGNGSGGAKGKGKGGEQLGAANWGALWNIMKGPLEKKGKRSRKGSVNTDEKEKKEEMEAKYVTGSPNSAAVENKSGITSPSEDAALPPSPPKSVRGVIERVNSQAATDPSYPQPDKWETLFEEDSTPTPIFIALMSTIFSRLDPEHTGFLSPETYSEFLETQGCVESNVWKLALDREGGEHSKEVADLELSLYFSDLLVSYTLIVRTRDPAADISDEGPQSAVEGKIRNSMRFNANMPMISRQGFIDVCAIEYLKDPDSAYRYLGKAVREYGVWRELGEVPREVLPEKSIPKLLRKETETPVAELASRNGAVNGESNKEGKDDSETLSPDPTESSNRGETPGDDDKVSEPSKTARNPKTSHAPEPIEVEKGRLVSPITIGSPALPFQLKGGEQKIDALAKGEEFEPAKDAEAKEENEPKTMTQYFKDIAEKKPEAVKTPEEKSKSEEPETKKSSIEDLYGAD